MHKWFFYSFYAQMILLQAKYGVQNILFVNRFMG